MKSYVDIVLNTSFSKDASDASWLSSLSQVASPPPPPPPPPPPSLLPPRVTTHASYIGTVQGGAPDSVVPISLRPSSDAEDKSSHDRYKALLKENANLTAEINRLHDFETGKNMLLRVFLAPEEPAS